MALLLQCSCYLCDDVNYMIRGIRFDIQFKQFLMLKLSFESTCLVTLLSVKCKITCRFMLAWDYDCSRHLHTTLKLGNQCITLGYQYNTCTVSRMQQWSNQKQFLLYAAW